MSTLTILPAALRIFNNTRNRERRGEEEERQDNDTERQVVLIVHHLSGTYKGIPLPPVARFP